MPSLTFNGGLIDPVGPGGDGVHAGLGAGGVGGGMVVAIIIGELQLKDGGFLKILAQNSFHIVVSVLQSIVILTNIV